MIQVKKHVTNNGTLQVYLLTGGAQFGFWQAKRNRGTPNGWYVCGGMDEWFLLPTKKRHQLLAALLEAARSTECPAPPVECPPTGSERKETAHETEGR